MASPRATWNCNSSWTVLSWLFMLCLSMSWENSVALEEPGGKQAASCTLNVSGDKGRLQHVGMTCTGTTTAKVDLDAAYYGKFRRRQFTGVRVTASNDGRCLITIYSGPTAGTIVLRNSSVVGVPAIPDMHTLVCAKQGNRLELHNSRFSNNRLRPLAAFDRAEVMLIASRVEGNVVNGWGGGLYLEGDATAVITAGSSLRGNIASGGGGGGVHVRDRARVEVDGGSSISGNTAQYGGGLQAWSNARVLLSGSSVDSNTAKYGGGLSASSYVQVTITNSSVSNNIANSDGGGVSATDSVVLIVANGTRIYNNRAQNGSGGGLDVSERVLLNITGGCSIKNNSCTGGVGGGICVGLFWLTDSDGLQFGGSGRLEGGTAGVGWDNSRTSVFISDSTIANNTSHHKAGGGLAVVSWSVVRLTDGTIVAGNTTLNSSGGAAMVMGSATFEADNTVVFANNSVSRGYVGSTIAAFDRSEIYLPWYGTLTKCSSSVYLGRTPCRLGELLQHDVCTCCPSHTFGFSNSSGCTKCPANAVCPGANIVDPLPGFWKSSHGSIQMHRCPLYKTACDAIEVCKPGYEGPLCGACKLPEYGMLRLMRCGRCMRAAVQLFLYLLVSFSTVLVMNYTIHVTWKGNIQGGREIYMTDYIKVLVQFLQYLVIIGSVSVPWPLFDVQQWLQAIGIVVTLGSGQAISLDCWLYNYVPQGRVPIAIHRQLVYFLTPVFALAFVLALQWFSWAIQRWVFCRPRERAAHSPRCNSSAVAASCPSLCWCWCSMPTRP